MMRLSRLFDNWFSNALITLLRLVLFAEHTQEQLHARNTSNNYDVLLGILDPAIADCRKELAETDQTKNASKVKTAALYGMILHFGNVMRSIQNYLNYKFPKEAEIHTLFFPNGLQEYTKATKTRMPLLVQRVKDLANSEAALLGDENSELLSGMKGLWEEARNAQEHQFGATDENRAERNAARVALELALVVVHTIGARHPGNKTECMSYFREELLAIPRNKSQEREEEEEEEENSDDLTN